MGMDFGILYEIELRKPYGPRAEYDVFQQVIAQVVEAERVGFTNFWSVEHHFLSEFAYSSAPEVLYGALRSHQQDPDRPRRAPAAVSVEPSDSRGRDGRDGEFLSNGRMGLAPGAR